MATAKAISKLIQTHANGRPYDVIFAGLQTVDGDTAHVPAQVAERLSYNQATYVEKVELMDKGLKVDRLVENGTQSLYVPFPTVISVTNTANTPRGPYLKGSMLARSADIKTYGIDDIGVNAEDVGLSGSPTVVSKVKIVKSERVLQKYDGHVGHQVSEFFKSLANVSNEVKEKSEE